jgi:phosphate transport system substrate-binding protein
MLRIIAFSALLAALSPMVAHSFSFKAGERNHISMVGSSTVYPFAAVIAENFGRESEFRTPVVESTGTGGGFKLFCSGIGPGFPDFSNASRAVKESETRRCAKNGIKNIIEIKIGYDGIVLANSVDGREFSLTKKQIFLALAAKVPSKSGTKLIANPYKKWSEIDSKLPKINIAIYGPPSTSGTRDAFVELVMEDPCKILPAFKKVYPSKKTRSKKCHIIRSDGHFIEAGENDNLIVQKLKNDKDALGIFGFSFLEENQNAVKAATIDNVDPSFESIVSEKYKVSRPLFIYVKREHFDLIPGMREFANEIISEDTIGEEGYLTQKGLIPLTRKELNAISEKLLKTL